MTKSFRTVRNYALFWVFLTGALYWRTDTVTLVTLGVGCLWSLRSPFHAVQALMAVWYATSFNNGIVFDPTQIVTLGGSSGVPSTLKILVISTAFARVVLARFSRTDAPPAPLATAAVLYGVVVSLLALISSGLVDVSLFKITLFVEGVVTCVLAVTLALQDRREDLFYWFWTALAMIVVLSAPLMFMGLGVVRNGMGFQGWLNQPQAFGIFIAPVTVLFFGLGFFDKYWPRLNIPLAALAAIEMLACLSRNAIIAAFLGIALGVVVSLRSNARRWLPVTVLFAVAAAVLFLLPSTQSYLSSLARKDQAGTGQAGIGASFNESRGMLITRALDNFKSEPLSGIGFGVAADPTEMTVVRDPVFGLPVSASVEKGVAWVAALEETGLIGMIALAWLLWELLAGAARQSSATGLATVFGGLMTNNGESTFFSFSGQGLIVWLIMIFAYTTSKTRA